MKKRYAALFVMGLFGLAGTVNAATCQPATGTLTCPANNLCVEIQHATTDTDGAAMPSITGTELTIGTLSPVVVPKTQAQYNYAVPKNTTLPAGTVLQGVTIANSANPRSAAFTCTTVAEVKGPQSVPAAPTLRGTAGQ